MADYYPLIARAVAGLEKNTGDARRALYERARTALVAQLRSVTPALSESDVTRERLALEESVRKVEAESARQNRVELRPEASKMRPPEMPRWEEPTPVPSSAEDPAPLHRAGSTPPRSDNLRRPPQPARTENGPAPPEGGLGEKHHADAVSDQPSLDVPPPVLGAARPQRHALRARPSGDRHSLLDSVDQFRNVVSETNDVAEMSVRPSKSARRSYAEAPPIMRDIDRGTPGGFGRNDADEVLQDAPAPEMLEPKLGLDEMRPLSNRPRPSQFVRDARQETERPSARSYRDLIRLAIALLLVSALGGVLAWQGPAIYRSLRAPPTMEVAGSETPVSVSRSKIVDRYEPGGATQTQQNAALMPGVLQNAAVAQRVVLYEEDPGEPQGKRFVGSAIWRTETITPGPGQTSELAIRADVEIPERRLAMTWSLRRNSDPALPASHTVEIMFKLPNDFASGGVSNVPGILMKQAEQARGVPLAGLAVKVTNGFFLIGLSSVEADKERNIALLKERSWFDIPVVYNNNRRAILALEKGTPGERAFGDAFAAWQQ